MSTTSEQPISKPKFILKLAPPQSQPTINPLKQSLRHINAVSKLPGATMSNGWYMRRYNCELAFTYLHDILELDLVTLEQVKAFTKLVKERLSTTCFDKWSNGDIASMMEEAVEATSA